MKRQIILNIIYKFLMVMVVAVPLAQAQGIITTVAGNGTAGFSGDGGPATSAALFFATDVAVDSAGNLFIADYDNYRIRKVNPSGIITTVAGNGTLGFSGDGGPATSAAFRDPRYIAVDGAGNIYIADRTNYRIRKVSPSGIISTIAGNGTQAFSGDGGPATSAAISTPFGLAVDSAGNLYFADTDNNRIRRVSTAGVITTVAGNGTGGFSGDGGPAISAQINVPWGVAVDAAGNLYFVEYNNSRVRKVNTAGIITTVAGGGNDFPGDGGAATSAVLPFPTEIAVDSAGNLYIAETDPINRVRKVTTAGIISTVAGNGTRGFSGDGGPATSASLSLPEGLAVDSAGNVYIADPGNHRIRKVTVPAVPGTLTVSPQTLSFTGTAGGAGQRKAVQISASGGVANWTATVTLLNGVGWLAASPPSGTASTNLPSTLALDVNFAAFAAVGTYQAEVLIQNTEAGGNAVRVPVTVVANPAGGRLQLSQTSFVFRMVEGGTAPEQTLRVSNVGTGNLSWQIPANLTAPQNWLRFSAQSGTPSAGTSNTVQLSIVATGLSAGVYQVVVPVSGLATVNHTQSFSVTVHVTPTATPALPELSSQGILFVAGQGGTVSQGLTVSNAGGGSLAFLLAAVVPWLRVSPATGSTAAVPVPIQITASATGLTPGVYRVRLVSRFDPGGIKEVDIVFVVSSDAIVPAREMPQPAACAAQSMEVVLTSLGTGAVVPVSFPKSLDVVVVDSCGNPINDAAVLASVGGPSITLVPVGNGQYSGNWTPTQASSAVTVSVLAQHATYAPVEKSFTVSAAAAPGNVTLPTLSSNGVVGAAGFPPQKPLVPGGIISLFGTGFAAGNNFPPPVFPVAKEVGGVSVLMGGEQLPLFYVGPTQINAQAPYSPTAGSNVSVVVKVGNKYSEVQNYAIASAQPGIFTEGPVAAVLDSQYRLVTTANPARRGDSLQIFATGLGATNPSAVAGNAPPAPTQVLLPVTVTIGGVTAAVMYQGLAPCCAGLYQVNAVVPSNAPTGNAVRIEIQQNGIASNAHSPATIPVASQ